MQRRSPDKVKHSSSLYFSIQGILFPGKGVPSKAVSLEVTAEGPDLVEIFSAGRKEVSSHRYIDAAIESKAARPKELEPRPLADTIPEDLAPYAPVDATSSFAMFRITMMSNLLYSKRKSCVAIPTQIDVLLDASGVGGYRLCIASDETLLELGPYSVSRMPIAMMLTIPTWLPEFLKVLLIALALWKISGALALVVIPWLSVFLLILALIALVAFIIMEISARRQASGGLTPAQNAALQKALRLKKMAEQRKEAIEQAGRELTPQEVQQVQDMLNEIVDTANELGETLNANTEDAEELKKVSEDLEQLQQSLDDALPD